MKLNNGKFIGGTVTGTVISFVSVTFFGLKFDGVVPALGTIVVVVLFEMVFCT